MLRSARRTLPALALCALGSIAGCGGSASHPAHATTTSSDALTGKAPISPQPRPPSTRLHASHGFTLPAPRSGAAAAAFGAEVILSGGLSSADVSTATVFKLDRHRATATNITLPNAIHDAAAAEISGRLLVFGGGPAEGSDRIFEVLPGPARQVGRLPQALSDLVAAAVGNVAYVAGGFNGSVTNHEIYAVRSDGSVSRAGSIPVGVRYPAAAALDGRLIIAGGETTSGSPTAAAWSFDPATRRVQRIPDLPAAIDHTAGAVLGGRFYLIAGLRRGVLSSAILSWAPGQARWHGAGHIPAPLSDLNAVPYDGGIALLGGRGSAGTTSAVTVMRP